MSCKIHKLSNIQIELPLLLAMKTIFTYELSVDQGKAFVVQRDQCAPLLAARVRFYQVNQLRQSLTR